MKRLLSILILACTLSACENDGAVSAPTPQGSAITFGSVETRVENESEINEFGVFVQQNLGKENEPTANQWNSLLEGERVYRTTSGFTYDNTRYWVDDRAFFFWAYYPYAGITAARTEEIEYVDVNGELQPRTTSHFTLNVSVPYAANADYMVAQKTEETVAGQPYPQSVDFNFEHLLSKVVFNVKKSDIYNANDKFIVTQVGLAGISRNGVFECTHVPGSRLEELLTSTAENRQVRRSNLNKEIDSSGVDVLDGGFYMLPQTLVENQVKLSVAYTYQQDSDDELQYLTVEKVIPVNTVNEWVKGKVYTYTLELAIDNNIYISTPSVTGWGSMQTGGTIIIQ